MLNERFLVEKGTQNNPLDDRAQMSCPTSFFYEFKHADAQKIIYVMCDLCKTLVAMNSKT